MHNNYVYITAIVFTNIMILGTVVNTSLIIGVLMFNHQQEALWNNNA